jgi:hypothetical protein
MKPLDSGSLEPGRRRDVKNVPIVGNGILIGAFERPAAERLADALDGIMPFANPLGAIDKAGARLSAWKY